MISQIKLNLIEQECKVILENCLHKDVIENDVILRKKACCVCDILLDGRDCSTISIERLTSRAWQKKAKTSTTRVFCKSEYRLPVERSALLSREELKMLNKITISCRSVVSDENGEKMLSICSSCKNAKDLPKYSIMNIPIGEEPPELACLTDVELALISKGKLNGHIFHMFAGCHKSIQTWHQLHVNNIGHTVGAMNAIESVGVENEIYCILAGPFTTNQRALALRSSKIDTHKVIRAFAWLKANNVHYYDIDVPDLESMPIPIVVDHSHIEESSGDSNIEERHETTVFFPDVGNLEGGNGVYQSAKQHLKQVLQSNFAKKNTIISKPTRDVLKDWQPDEFVKAFPRQFPYGLGVQPAGIDADDYLKHLMNLSGNAFQRAEFILVATNCHFKHKMVKNASMKCNYKCGDQTAADRFNDIDVEEIDNVIDDPDYDENGSNTNLSYFVRSVFAVSKLMPFSDECVKEERKKLFSMCTMFGLPTGLLTVTPDDSDNLNMYIYKMADEKVISKLHNQGIDEINKYLSDCEQIRLDFPGYATFEFEKVIQIVIANIFGWDVDGSCSSPDGGIFGKLKAWFLAVEEQGRKTLHGHFLIWTEGWDLILKQAYDSSEQTTDSIPGAFMSRFVDANVSTKCFGLKIPKRGSSTNVRQTYTPADMGLLHECSSREPCYQYATHQELRNMRFQYCPNTSRDMQVACCLNCNKSFSLEDIKQQVLRIIFREKMRLNLDEMDLDKILRYVISISQSYVKGIEQSVDVLPIQLRNTLIHIHRNLHRQLHANTCFKHGPECRAKLPAPPQLEASCEFLTQRPISWYKWNGKDYVRFPYRLHPPREELDILTNMYQPFISELLHSNSNLLVGIDGAGCIYLTLYACKSTRLDDRYNQLSILHSVKRVINREVENSTVLNSPVENPRLTAFKRIFFSALSSTTKYTLCAPMAKYLVQNGSRYRCSHDFTHVPFYDFMKGESSYAKLEVSLRNLMFLSARRDTYLFRPDELKDVDPYTFYSNYQVQTYHENSESAQYVLQFQKEASSGYRKLCLAETNVVKVPIIYFHMFESSPVFGQDITNPDVETTATVENHCKKILLLFCPYRLESEVLIENTYKKSLIAKINQGMINSKFETYMQNMQNCRSSLDSGRLPDMLEETTEILPEPENVANNRKSRKPPENILDFIEQQCSAVISEVTEAMQQLRPKDTNLFDLSKLTSEGAKDIGSDVGLQPAAVTQNGSNFYAEGNPLEGRGEKRKKDYTYSKPTVEAIVALHQKEVFRATCLTERDRLKVANIVATGTRESIVAWAKAAFNDDINQTMAFQSLIADFVLQYVTEAGGGDLVPFSREWTNDLKNLRGISRQKKRVVMFLTGPGGSGKSHVIQNILQYGKEYTKHIGQDFTSRTIVVTALTGSAATSILGETLHSVAHINRSGNYKASQEQLKQTRSEWEGTKMIIVDEISFATKNIVVALGNSLRQIKQNDVEPYGGITVCFAGDFSQLEPINKKDAIYKGTPIDAWHTWINAFVELDGTHRFTDTKFVDILTRLRSSRLNRADYQELNKCVINRKNLSNMPPGTQIACATNKDRCAMNNLAFQSHLHATHSIGQGPQAHTMIVMMGEMKWVSNNKYMTDECKHSIYEGVGDHNMKRTHEKKSVDPFLKLYHGCPIMLSENVDVKRGIANGTTATVSKIVLKQGHIRNIKVLTVDKYQVNAIDATSVEYILVEMENPDKTKREIALTATAVKATAFMSMDTGLSVSMKYDVPISGYQFTFLVNHATTVHKLQGKTVESLYIVNWCYMQNWVYVALSRVKTKQNLFLRFPLDPTRNVEPYSELNRMLISFRGTKRLCYPNDMYVI